MDSMVSTTCLAVTSLFVTLSSIAVGLRIWARRIKSLQLEADDYTVLIALVLCYGLLIITIVAGSVGGVDEIVLDPLTAAEWFIKIVWVEPFLVSPSLAAVKISIVLMYKRIFKIKPFRIACNIMISIITAWALTNIIVQLNMARPVSGVWNVLGNHIVINYSTFALTTAGISTGLDLITLCLPLPVISRLHLTRRKKLITIGIFWLGVFCVVAGAVRFYYGYREIASSIASNGNKRYAIITQVYLWDRIEPCASVIAACLPTYGPLVRDNRFFKAFFASITIFYSFSSGRKSTTSKKGAYNNSPQVTGTSQPQGAWERPRKHSDVVQTVVSINDIEQGPQSTLPRYPDEIHLTSTIDLEYSKT